MKPEELLNVETLPEDLHWLASEYRLQPNDPVYLLVAWHWHRIQKGEDSLRSALMDLKAAVDSRIATVVGSSETVLAVQEQLKQVQDALEQKPAALGRQLEADLQRPVTRAVAEVNAAARAAANLVEAMQTALAAAQNRQALAALLVGFVLGGSSVAILLLP
ncbi:MAG: hypothetical protein PSU94_00120 [Lacunisphaera sp.]|nr:hypothetical protein [Lacunisphaera sp.]